MRSVALHAPDCRRIIIATDGRLEGVDPDLADEIEAISFVDGFGLMTLYYDAVELNTAVKPFAFKHLFERFGAKNIVYLDPDVALFAPIDPVFEALESASIALTPHLHRPLSEGFMPDDAVVLRSGAYNLGFLGLARSADTERFLDWWAQKLRFECRVHFAMGLFTDQRWVDLAPGFFGAAAILRDPGLNLAYWNLPGRALTDGPEGWRVDGAPLRFFHFSGFSPSRPQVLSKYQSRIWPKRGEPLTRLLAHYAKALKNAGYATYSTIPYAFVFIGDGRRLTGLMRRTILNAARLGAEFPDPLSRTTSLWLDAPDPSVPADAVQRPTRVMMQFLREVEAGAGFRPWRTWGEAFDLFQANGAKLGADPLSLAAAEEARLGRAPAAGSQDMSDNVFRDMPESLRIFWRERPEVQASFPLIGDELAAYALGPAALSGGFAASSLADWLAGLTDERLLIIAHRALDFARETIGGCAADAQAGLAGVTAAYGLGPQAQWPSPMIARLRASLFALREGSDTFGLPDFALLIWRARADLQAAFDIGKPVGRLGFYRWLLTAGMHEYGLHKPTILRCKPLVGSLVLLMNAVRANP